MNINTIKVKWSENELSQNTHIVEFKNCCVVIDAGCGVKTIKKITNKPIKAVLLTHGHFDHIKDIEEYNELNIPIYAHKEILKIISNPILNASNIFNQPSTYKINNINYIENEQVIEIDDHKIQCFHTSGHSVDSMCYLVDNLILFSGDTVFSVAVGRDDLPTGNTKELISSLNKILNLDYIHLYTGHGRPSSKEEQKINIPKWIEILDNKKEIY